ncbi:hypothetical protein ACCO45_007166 [Purpureocillium lilacinum]|uniref:Uncharacterized protein n=1 Tax=Purpureocillium lilacinum TaxID=33203 RepID=A0ACC4DT00_PURLI
MDSRPDAQRGEQHGSSGNVGERRASRHASSEAVLHDVNGRPQQARAPPAQAHANHLHKQPGQWSPCADENEDLRAPYNYEYCTVITRSRAAGQQEGPPTRRRGGCTIGIEANLQQNSHCAAQLRPWEERQFAFDPDRGMTVRQLQIGPAPSRLDRRPMVGEDSETEQTGGQDTGPGGSGPEVGVSRPASFRLASLTSWDGAPRAGLVRTWGGTAPRPVFAVPSRDPIHPLLATEDVADRHEHGPHTS